MHRRYRNAARATGCSHSSRCVLVASSAVLSLVLLTAAAATVPAGQLTGALHWRSVGPYLGGRVTSLPACRPSPASSTWPLRAVASGKRKITDIIGKTFRINISRPAALEQSQ